MGSTPTGGSENSFSGYFNFFVHVQNKPQDAQFVFVSFDLLYFKIQITCSGLQCKLSKNIE